MGCPPSKGWGNFAFGARKTIFSHSRRITKAPWPGEGGGGGVVTFIGEAVPYPHEEKKTEKGVGAEHEKGVQTMQI